VSRRLQADVLVVGGGPAGSAAAGELAARGQRVILAEASPGPRHRVCGEFISAEALPLLQQLGALPAAWKAAPALLERAVFSTPSGQQLDVRLPDLSTGEGGALGLSRRVLDETLLKRAEQRGAQVLRNTRFLSLLHDARGAAAGALLRAAEGTLAVDAGLVIGADGRGSAVARDAGLDRPVRGNLHCAIKAHFEAGDGFDGLERRVEIHLFPGGYVGMQPVEGDRINVSAVIEASLARRLGGGSLAILVRAARGNPAARQRLRGARPAGAPLSLFPLERRRWASLSHGLLLAGDAAQVVPPFAGDGISAALCSGILAARTANAALDDGDVTAARLSSYRAGRRRHMARPMVISGLLEHLFYRPALASALLPVLQRTPAVPRFLLRSTRLRGREGKHR
jgi:flavin-dependent dehydrogenase